MTLRLKMNIYWRLLDRCRDYYELQQNVQVSTTNLDSLQLEYLSTGELVVLAANQSVSVYDEDGNVTPVNFTITPERYGGSAWVRD